MHEKFQSEKQHVVGDSTEKSMLEDGGRIESTAYYRAADNIVSRNIAGETVLVPVGEQAKRLNGLATFTETGQFLWNLLSQNKYTIKELSVALSEEYEQPETEIQEDVRVYLEKMLNYGFVVQCG